MYITGVKMFMLLYADDTVICSESAEGLQQALDKWSLRVNVDKTIVFVFSRGTFPKMPTITREEVWRSV